MEYHVWPISELLWNFVLEVYLVETYHTLCSCLSLAMVVVVLTDTVFEVDTEFFVPDMQPFMTGFCCGHVFDLENVYHAIRDQWLLFCEQSKQLHI